MKRYHFWVPIGRLNFLKRWAVKILCKIHPNQYLAVFQNFPQISHLWILHVAVHPLNMLLKYQWRLYKLCHKLIFLQNCLNLVASFFPMVLNLSLFDFDHSVLNYFLELLWQVWLIKLSGFTWTLSQIFFRALSFSDIFWWRIHQACWPTGEPYELGRSR